METGVLLAQEAHHGELRLNLTLTGDSGSSLDCDEDCDFYHGSYLLPCPCPCGESSVFEGYAPGNVSGTLTFSAPYGVTGSDSVSENVNENVNENGIGMTS